MLDDPQDDEGGLELAIGTASHTTEPDPDDHAPAGDALTSDQFNKAGSSASTGGTEGAGVAAEPACELETARTKEEIRDAEEMTNDSALPGLVSEDIGGAGAALNSML